jgi:hypothetical protein
MSIVGSDIPLERNPLKNWDAVKGDDKVLISLGPEGEYASKTYTCLRRSAFGLWTMQVQFVHTYTGDVLETTQILVGSGVVDRLKEIGIPEYVEGL